MNVVSKNFSLFLICSHGFSVLIVIKRGTMLPRFADEKILARRRIKSNQTIKSSEALTSSFSFMDNFTLLPSTPKANSDLIADVGDILRLDPKVIG